MPKITLRPQRVSDAKRFFEILSSPRFKYFSVRIKSVEEERKFLKTVKQRAKSNFEHGYTILYGKEIVGGCGLKINQHRNHIGEIGYFLDENYWNKGIATRAVKLLENIGFKKLGLKRMEILMMPANKASEKVAVKCGYKKEGRMKGSLKHKDKFLDSWIYAKVRS